MVRCPYCGRSTTINERYCHFCEQDLSKAVNEEEKPQINKPKPYNLKEDIEKIKKVSKALYKNIKKKVRK